MKPNEAAIPTTEDRGPGDLSETAANHLRFDAALDSSRLLQLTRRQFLGRGAAGLGVAALASLLNPGLAAADGLAGLPHRAPRARRVIWLTQAGAPSQADLFDYKPSCANGLDRTCPSRCVAANGSPA